MNFTRQTIPTVSAAQEEPKQETAKQATVNIRVDANCSMLCDGEYIETQFQANKITKMNLPLGQHLLEFFDMDYPDIIVEQEVNWQEEGKAYLVIIKGLQEKIEAARQADEDKKRDAAAQKAQAEAERMAKEKAARRAIAEMERKATEEAERKIREEEERKAKVEAEQKAKEDAGSRKIINNHDFVDFGIEGMPLWATCNLGASSPEQRGDRYAWGETQTKNKFKASNYEKKGKYNKRDGKTQLDLEDDAARAQWGGKWQMPTADDFDLLSKKCKLEKATVNGKSGLFVSHNGKSIFLPDLPIEFAYWTASPLAGSEDEAISAKAYGDYIRLSGGLEMRYSGYFIRPIMRKCDLGESAKPQPVAPKEEPKKEDNKADNKDAVVYVSYTSEEGDNCAYLFIVVNRKFYWVDENYNVAEPIDEKLMNSYIQGCERGDYEEWDETLDSYDSIEEFLEAVGGAKKEAVEDEGECMSENGEYTVTMFVGSKKVCEKVVS